jgi:branched-chain amino acid transport system ATP-binding protein
VSGEAVLEVRGLTRRFGGVAALDGLDLQVGRGEIRCVIGPNGAGKTTFLNVVSGLVRPSAGTVTVEGRDVTGKSAKRIADLGVVRTFQTPTVFGGLTVRANVALGATRPGAPSSGAPARADRVLEELALDGRREDCARDLSHGEKKRLELAMVLAGEPRILMLDEPTAGMSIRETDEIVGVVQRLRGAMTVLVIEHDMSFVRQIADRVSVFHRGALLTEGSLEDVKADREVQDIYLGSPID